MGFRNDEDLDDIPLKGSLRRQKHSHEQRPMLARLPRIWILTLILITFIAYRTYDSWHQGHGGLSDHELVLQDFKRPDVAAQVIVGSGRIIESQHQQDTVTNSTLGFQKIFAINLPSRTDKRDGLLLASKLTGFNIELVDGVDPTIVSEKALPQRIPSTKPLKAGVVGCWRAHMNFLSRVIQDDLATALVLEDDADWDMRLLTQLKEFAVMTNNILTDASTEDRRKEFKTLDATQPLSTSADSPYGHGWDVLLLGNCGVDIDKSKPYVVRERDDTVPDMQHLKIYGEPNGMRLLPYPSHTRLVGHALDQTCTYAYAVTQNAARRMLLDLGLERLDNPIDHMLRDWCEGKYAQQGPPRRCIGVLPSLFESYRREGPADQDSDIDGDKDNVGYREQSHTPHIRKSVRMNLRQLMDGDTDIQDRYPNFRFPGPAVTRSREEATARPAQQR